MKTPVVFAIALCANIFTPYVFAAAIGQASTANGAAFSGACAGSQDFYNLTDPGSVIDGGISNASVNCSTQSGSIGGATSASASNAGSQNGFNFTNSSAATSAPGAIHLSALNNASVNIDFPGASAYGGWNDSFIWGGNTGVWTPTINIDGTMSAFGNGASGLVQVAVYHDNSIIQPYNTPNNLAYAQFVADNIIHNGTDIYSSWDYEMVGFGVADYGPSDPGSLQTLSVNRTLTFAIPVTFGQAVNFGFYIDILAGERAYGSLPNGSVSNMDFANTVYYSGPGQLILADGSVDQTFTGADIGPSASGFNYSLSYSADAPEPSTFGLLILGCSALGWKLRSRRLPRR